MDVKVDPAAMQDLVTKAIFDGMSEEVRSGLVKQALTDLMTRPKDSRSSFGGQPLSPLQEAFNGAARFAADRIVRERFEKDEEFTAQVEGLFRDVAKKLFADAVREDLVKSICDQVIKGLRPRDY